MSSSLSSRNFLTAFNSWLTLPKLASLIALFVTLILLPDLAGRPKFHPDEPKWTEASIFTFSNFLKGSETPPEVWQQSLDTYGVQNPLLGKLIIGASLYCGGYRTFSKMPEWNWKRSVEWHHAQGRLPKARKLFYARLPVALASACLLGMVVYLAGIGAAGYLDSSKPVRSACLLAAGLSLPHPLFLTYSRRVGLDIFALLFTTAAVLCVVHSVLARVEVSTERFQWRSFAWYVAACFAASLALNAKLNGALAVIFVGACGLLPLIPSRKAMSYRNRSREFLYGLLVLLLSVLLVTYLLTPLARTEPLKVIEEWNNLNSIVQDVYTKWFPNKALHTFQERSLSFFRNALSLYSLPSYIGSWLGLMGIIIYILVLLLKLKDDVARDSAQLFGLWLVISGAALLKWVPLERPRYYLPFFPLLIIAACHSCIFVTQSIFNLYQRQRRP